MNSSEYKVEFRQVQPDILPIDFEGAHLILTGPLAWFYGLFMSMDCEEKARQELYPWLKEAKRKAVSVPQQNTAPSLNQGI